MSSGGVWRRVARLRQHFYEGTAKGEGGRHAPQMPRFLPVLIVVFSAAILGAWMLFVGFARLIGFEVSLWRPALGSLPPEQLFDVTRAAATAAGVLAGVFAIVYAYRKQRVDEAAGRREDSEQLSQRYQTAAEELGHARAAVRLAGVYAMSRLADDWVDQRQQCVDVLCAYLRLPVERPEVVAEEEEVLRRAIVREIDLHTQSGRSDGKSWSDLRIDLSGADLSDVSFDNNTFSVFEMERATIRGELRFSRCRVKRYLGMSGVQVHGRVSLLVVGPSGRVSMWNSCVHDGGRLTIGARSSGVTFFMASIEIAPEGEVSITVPDGSKNGAVDLRRGKVAGRLAIYGTGKSCEPGAVKMRDLVTVGSGSVGLQAEFTDAAVVRPVLVPSSTLSLARFEVGEWTVVEDD